jgi:hypothetical protein
MTTDKSWPRAARRTKINSSDPSLTAVRTADATEPLLALFRPIIELATWRPRGRLDLDRRIDHSAIYLGTLLQVIVAQIHV